MKPAAFDYLKPDSLDQALAALAADPEAQLLAGGQSLLAMMNMRIARPTTLVDITGIAALGGIAPEAGGLRIGALATHADLETDPAVAAAAPLLARAARELAHPAIRNRGTIGGSLALADPQAELPAAALALGGRIEVRGGEERREIAAEDFWLGAYETALRPGEAIVAIRTPPPAPDARSAYLKLARRHGDYAMVGLAVSGRFAGGRAHDLRLAFFAVGDRPRLATAAALALEGSALDAAALDRAAGTLDRDLAPVDHPDCAAPTKLHLAGVVLRRAMIAFKG